MQPSEIQDACERGQQLLIQTEYWSAELILAEAENAAWMSREFDALSRLYLPLQECRRQRRQKCLDGIICLDILARSPEDSIDPKEIVNRYPQGTLLVGGWQSITLAVEVRRLQFERRQYAETFLAAVYPAGESISISISPFAAIEPQRMRTGGDLMQDHSLMMHESTLRCGPGAPAKELAAQANTLWELLHAPFLLDADRATDPLHKIELYRKTIEVDYGCELAHQKLAEVARQLA
jgi:hypothetical protein